MPSTSPRRRTNHGLTTMAPNTSATDPVPTPTNAPQSRYSCQGAVITVVSAVPAATSANAQAAVRRTPTCSISPAANGAVIP